MFYPLYPLPGKRETEDSFSWGQYFAVLGESRCFSLPYLKN